MDIETTKSVLLPIHGTLGFVSLLAGGYAMLMRSRGATHARVGRVFAVSMVGAVLLAVPVLVVTGNVFLTTLGFIAAWMLATGWRFARLRNGPANAFDRALPILGMCVFAAGAVWGLTLVPRAGLLGVVPLVLGALGSWLALNQLRGLRGDPAERNWMRLHGAAIGGAWIASMTAFAAATVTNWIPAVPEWILWVGPSLLGVPLLRRRVRRFAGDS